MKAYQSTLFFLALLVVFTLLTRGSRALGESIESSNCSQYFEAGMIERPRMDYQVEKKYTLECKDSLNNKVITRFKNFTHVDACISAYQQENPNAPCWCRMY